MVATKLSRKHYIMLEKKLAIISMYMENYYPRAQASRVM